jgi:AraC family transcriptional regulator, arabinose operon regulatory protein
MPHSRTRKTAHAYGALSALMKDHLYVLDGGHLFTSPWVVTEASVRRSATVLLTASGTPFELGAGKEPASYQAVAIKPLTKRSIRAENAQLVSLLINPLHRHFRAFRAIRAPGVLALPRDAFAPLNAALYTAYSGKLTAAETEMLFDRIVETTVGHLPKIKCADPRMERAMELLRQNENCSLKELAASVGVSYGRMSHLFADSMGLSLRSFQLWRKIHAALNSVCVGRTLTDIARSTGFTDVAHLSRVVQQAFGAPLTYFLNTDHLQIFQYRRAPPPAPIRARNAALS